MQLHRKEGECRFLILVSTHLGRLIDRKQVTTPFFRMWWKTKKDSTDRSANSVHLHIRRSDLLVHSPTLSDSQASEVPVSTIAISGLLCSQIRQIFTGNQLTQLDMTHNDPGPEVHCSIVVYSPGSDQANQIDPGGETRSNGSWEYLLCQGLKQS